MHVMRCDGCGAEQVVDGFAPHISRAGWARVTATREAISDNINGLGGLLGALIGPVGSYATQQAQQIQALGPVTEHRDYCPTCAPKLQIRVGKTFEEVWAALGYEYGEEALEQVKLGWRLCMGQDSKE